MFACGCVYVVLCEEGAEYSSPSFSWEAVMGKPTHLRLMRGTDKNTFQIPLKHNPVFIP